MSEINYIKVNELSPNTREINLLAKIVQLGEVREVTNRNTGEQHKVMDVLIGDETGTVYFSAWNEQIDEINEDETYQFLNSKTILFKRHIRLSLGREGYVESSDKKIKKIDMENNLSETEHEDTRRYRRRSYQNRSSYNRSYNQ
ncbi:MAG: hypothetical protein ACFFDS_06735 [Candidatus Thorarchaeota archaeon]